VFAELNRGSEVTKGLRKVDKSEMTHKNPALRASSTVPSTVGSSGSSAGARHSYRPLDVMANMLSLVVSPKEASQTSKTAGAHGEEAREIRIRRQQMGDCMRLHNLRY
jgi:hypothetical protein